MNMFTISDLIMDFKFVFTVYTFNIFLFPIPVQFCGTQRPVIPTGIKGIHLNDTVWDRDLCTVQVCVMSTLYHAYQCALCSDIEYAMCGAVQCAVNTVLCNTMCSIVNCAHSCGTMRRSPCLWRYNSLTTGDPPLYGGTIQNLLCIALALPTTQRHCSAALWTTLGLTTNDLGWMNVRQFSFAENTHKHSSLCYSWMKHKKGSHC